MLVYYVEFQIYGCLDIVTFDGYRSLTAEFSLLNTSCQRKCQRRQATEIAERIFLSVHTVNTHRQRIYSKMGVKNVSDMLRKATELGII